MIVDFKQIESSALKLDRKERTRLAKRLLLSLENQVDEEIEQAWEAEVDRRKRETESGEVALIPADEVLAKAHRGLKK